MQAEYIRDRTQLWHLKREHPEWSQAQLAEAVGRSVRWVKKWVKRFGEEPPDSRPEVFLGRKTGPKEPRQRVDPEVVERILAIRDEPPDSLRRVPGPKAIQYVLQQQTDLIEAGHYLPRSTRTIWKILVAHDRIWRPRPREYQPVERPEPDQVWALDFKDISTVPGDPEGIGKKQHAVEALNLVDEGTSRLVDSQVRDDFKAETTLIALTSVFLLRGLPQGVKMDRDVRFIGSWTAQDFPSPLMRFLLCLGLDIELIPPRRPDKNPFVERFHRTLQEEFISLKRPTTLEDCLEGIEEFKTYYNHHRPNQALSCDNQPPAVAFPGQSLPSVPDMVDPDRWLTAIDRQRYTRRVMSNGSIKLGDHSYYVQQALAGCRISLEVQAAKRELAVYAGRTYVRQLSVKGLHGAMMSFSTFVTWMCEQARTVDRRLRYRKLT